MLQGYLLGKVEGSKHDDLKKDWHGHVSAVTIAPQFRRQGLARLFMDYLEDVTIKMHNGFFVDLFVKPSNTVAINMYKSLGYIVYRRVLDYYSGGSSKDSEDAFDMRKAMPRDKDKSTVIPLDKPIKPH
jgi:N-terminal acetyltransferase B complex catalytic subunit